VKLGKRTVRRGAIDKIVRFAEARAARLAAAPPLEARSRGEGLPRVEVHRVAAVARTWPFAVDAAAWSTRAWPVGDDRGPSLVIAMTEGAFFGGSFAWLSTVVSSEARPVVACDAFVHPAQVRAASRAGAYGIAPLLRATSRAGVELADLTSWAASHGLFVLPLYGDARIDPAPTVASGLPDVFFYRGARPVVLASGRDPESFRPLDEVEPGGPGEGSTPGADQVVVLRAFGGGAECYVDAHGGE
jgi:hypothetical protein